MVRHCVHGIAIIHFLHHVQLDTERFRIRWLRRLHGRRAPVHIPGRWYSFRSADTQADECAR